MLSKAGICVIAEAGVNHNGSIDLAEELIRTAAEAGADIVKFQTFKASKLTTPSAIKAQYQTRNHGASGSQQDMLRKLELSEKDHFKLMDSCERQGIEFLSTPFDDESLEFLTSHRLIKRIKVPSGEITNLPFLLKLSRSGLPIILSSGMATLGEIESALMCIAFGMLHSSGIPDRDALIRAFVSNAGQDALRSNVTLLHCTTEYPAPFEEVNLRVLQSLRSAFPVQVGYSDHTEGIAIPMAAVALGSVVIEKHFTLDKSMDGPDHKASLAPEELVAMIQGIRHIEASLGTSIKFPSESELKNRSVARKSLVAAHPIERGTVFTAENLTCKRPGSGIPAQEYWNLLGKRASRSFQTDELIDLGSD
jgi:N-acetylneuraminate synthase